MKKVFKVLAASSAFLFLLGGCGTATSATSSTASSGGKVKVAVVLKTLSSQYWQMVAAGARDAAKKDNVDLQLLGPNSETDVNGQVNDIRDVLGTHPQALIVSPIQASTCVPVFNQAKSQNIPVLMVDTNPNWPDQKTFIGTQNYEAGKEAGAWLAKQLGKNAKVAILKGLEGNPTMDDRANGAKDALVAAGDQIVALQPADSDRGKAFTVMQNILQAHPDVQGVFAANDDEALGASRALQQASKKIPILGMDGTEDGLNAIISGTLTGTIAQDPYNMGYLGVEDAVKVIKSESIPNLIPANTQIITKDNAQKKLTQVEKILAEYK